MPSAAYFATVPAPFDASSSGWAWTERRQSGASGELLMTSPNLPSAPGPDAWSTSSGAAAARAA